MRPLFIALALSLAVPALAEPPPRPPGDRMEQMAERESEILAWVRSQDAEKARRIEALKERDPERYRLAIRRAARLMKASEQDPELLARRERLQEIHRELQGLAALDSDDKKIAKAREEQIRALVEEAFDLRMEGAEARIDAMEAKLEEAREKLEEAKGERDERIDEHVQKVLSGEMPERGRE